MKRICLLVLVLSPVLAISQEKAPLPSKLVEAKTVFLLNQTGRSAILDGAYQALKKWGRWQVVTAREEADLVLLINGHEETTHIYSSPGAIVVPGVPAVIPGTMPMPVTNEDWFLHVLESATGEPLWTTLSGGTLIIENTGKNLVEALRKQMAGSSEPTALASPESHTAPIVEPQREIPVVTAMESERESSSAPHLTEPPLGRKMYIENYEQMSGEHRQVADCLMFKLKERGEFTFETSRFSAETILLLDIRIPGGASRVLWGRSPSVRLAVSSSDGKIVWTGENKFKKSTTLWGAPADVPCGLANGLADKFVMALQDNKIK